MKMPTVKFPNLSPRLRISMAVESPDRTSPSFLDRMESPLLHFVKYHGLGNDFITDVDNRDSSEPKVSPEQALKLCDRNFRVGVIFVMPGVNGNGYAMRNFNSEEVSPRCVGMESGALHDSLLNSRICCGNSGERA